ncbi:MAG TPA: hypothetical protein VNO30_49475 [Kofleriaceae bacterium]|nr:hypothetical protein [Kofleriaceae bacterium]
MAKRFEYAQAEEIRDAFARQGVRYLFLGKSGAILLGYPDTTQDADLFVEKSPANGAAIVAALDALGFELTDSERAEIQRGKDFIQLKNGHSRSATEQTSSRANRPRTGPAWNDAPPEHQAALAAMDRLDDDALWKLAGGRRSEAEMVRYDELLEQSAAGALGDVERSELERLRREADRFMLVKAHAAVLLRWRGHDVPAR